uniref:BrnA antitoxin of type II toxin-antitoxin system n=3 Tax=cellular organisms TaxID=131567 RepID=A0AAR5NZ67_DENPD
MEIEFSWDEHKADTNLKKHGVAFEDATLVFYDAHAVFKQDRFENGEYRWQAIGMHDRQRKKRGNSMNKTVTYKVDLNKPPVLSEEQKARLEALAKRPDSEIDFSDIPELDKSFWKNAVQNPFYKPTKQVTTVRIDADVMQWLKAQGKGYQTRMNKILRDAMLNDLKNHP